MFYSLCFLFATEPKKPVASGNLTPLAVTRMLSEIIDHLEIDLHPSFPNPKKILREAPYSISGGGWGSMPLTFTFHFQSPHQHQQLVLTHDLSLNARTGGHVQAFYLHLE